TGQFIFVASPARRRGEKAKEPPKFRIINKISAPEVELPSKHTIAVFSLSEGGTLYFNDIRRFGYLKLVRDVDIPHVRELAEFGPEPLSKAFTFQVFSEHVRRHPSQAIKTTLMDSRVIAGIGNIYSDEILFHAAVAPLRKVKTLSEDELRHIFQHIRPVLEKGIAAKGSSVGDFVRTDGSWGTMGKFHYVYGRKGQKCKKCKATLMAVKVGGRTGTFCPSCQR
ncbi:MAG TPA: zinc finger domain-containing protein, partial [Patescibacteria group bacterium]|nr:zinc finger domain-containing protein [Patescibacteria group bacterium]